MSSPRKTVADEPGVEATANAVQLEPDVEKPTANGACEENGMMLDQDEGNNWNDKHFFDEDQDLDDLDFDDENETVDSQNEDLVRPEDVNSSGSTEAGVDENADEDSWNLEVFDPNRPYANEPLYYPNNCKINVPYTYSGVFVPSKLHAPRIKITRTKFTPVEGQFDDATVD